MHLSSFLIRASTFSKSPSRWTSILCWKILAPNPAFGRVTPLGPRFLLRPALSKFKEGTEISAGVVYPPAFAPYNRKRALDPRVAPEAKGMLGLHLGGEMGCQERLARAPARTS